MEKAAGALFGASVNGWPAGFALLEIAGLSSALEQALTECGVRVLWRGAASDGRPDSLALVTPESDRASLSLALLQIQINEPGSGPLAQGVAGNPGGQAQANVREAVDSSDEDSSDEDNDETRSRPVGKHSTALMIAALLDDDDLLRTLLANGADPNRRDPNGRTALMIAASRGHLRIVRSLIHDRRTKANLTNTSEWDALCEAAAEGHRKVVSLLLSFGGVLLPLQVSQILGVHPLLLAARHGHHAVCELFVSKGVDIDMADHSGWTALWYAAHDDHLACCERLLDAGANINHIVSSGSSLIFFAAFCNKLALFDLLVKRGATLTCGRGNKPLLNAAVKLNGKEVVRRLIELKIDINATDSKKKTALTVACQTDSTEIAEILLKAGAKPDVADKDGWNSLVYAARNGNNKLLELLFAHGAKLRGKEDFGYLALYEATRNARLDAMKLLLSMGAPVVTVKCRLPSASYSTPLILLPMNPVAYSSDKQLAYDAVCLLIQYGTPLNEVDQDGRDVLMMAVTRRVLQLIPPLFNSGMTAGQADRFGLNALQLAARMADEALDGMPGPDSAPGALDSLWAIVEIAKRQSNWIFLASAGIRSARHLITREIMCQLPDYAELTAANGISFNSSSMVLAKAQVIMHQACLDVGNGWDRVTTEIWLCNAAVPVPAITAYCAHIEAFPVMKRQLFGPGPTAEIPPPHWDAFFHGVTANMGKMVVAGHEIEDAYEDLGWGMGRDVLTAAARSSIWVASESSLLHEQELGMAFTTLFDDCLQAALSFQSEQVLDLHGLPTSGIIAKTLMRKGVYAALADEIEKAWRTVWSETIEAAPAAASSSSSASSGEFSSRPEAVAMRAADSGTSIPMSYKQLGEQQSSELLSAFRKALAKNVDSPRLLALPGASPKVAGLYADLMHRQLHMLVQFIHGEDDIEDEVAPVPVAVPVPVPVPVPAAAPAPEYQPEPEDLAMSEDWTWIDDWPWADPDA